MPRPMTPAPTTIVFGRVEGTILGALMTDSLHRATPAPRASTPASRQFQAEPRADARIFCAVPGRAAGRAGVLNLLVRVVAHSADMRAVVRAARKGILPS